MTWNVPFAESLKARKKRRRKERCAVGKIFESWMILLTLVISRHQITFIYSSCNKKKMVNSQANHSDVPHLPKNTRTLLGATTDVNIFVERPCFWNITINELKNTVQWVNLENKAGRWKKNGCCKVCPSLGRGDGGRIISFKYPGRINEFSKNSLLKQIISKRP